MQDVQDGSILNYFGLDPDDVYHIWSDGSLTFIFVPESGNLWLAKFPKTHSEMLDNPTIVQDVYKNYLQANPQVKYKELNDRGSAIEYGDAILGRIGLDGTTPLIALWEGKYSENREVLRRFMQALYRRLPGFKQFRDQTVLLLKGRRPMTIPDLLGEKGSESPARNVALKPVVQAKQKDAQHYLIGGKRYTLADLQQMRADVHAKGTVNPALCQIDDKVYPELRGYRPANCNHAELPLRKSHPQNWRRAGIQAGMPYLYTPEHDVNFKNWLLLREAIQIL